jgi:type VI secretion system secreted protein VgrG
MIYEGGYANDPADSGGETYRGISRRNFPHWEGWSIIDDIKRNNPKNFKKIINNLVNSNPSINEMVEFFYRENFWDGFRGDYTTDQKIANFLFDARVNMGANRPIKYLQAALNEITGSKLAVDGIYGNGTHNILLMCLENEENKPKLLAHMNNQRKNTYLDIVNRKPSQKKFLKGWLNRVKEFE